MAACEDGVCEDGERGKVQGGSVVEGGSEAEGSDKEMGTKVAERKYEDFNKECGHLLDPGRYGGGSSVGMSVSPLTLSSVARVCSDAKFRSAHHAHQLLWRHGR